MWTFARSSSGYPCQTFLFYTTPLPELVVCVMCWWWHNWAVQCDTGATCPAQHSPARHQEASWSPQHRGHLHWAGLSLWTTGSHQMWGDKGAQWHSVQLTRPLIISRSGHFLSILSWTEPRRFVVLEALLLEISTIFGLQQTFSIINDEIKDIKLILLSK